ncbi:MAG: Arm DNA-binding domain-containing protein, partial [Gammaproteobacteria bacterium]|nr:Arm DNA-binding domain-containing protein [Gammaproteobacteria bacterium]
MSNSKCNLNARTVAAAKPADKPYELRDIKTVGFLLRVQPSGVMSFVAEFRPGKGRRKKRVTVGQSPVWTVERARRRAVAIMAHGGRLPTQGREVLTLREFI